MRKASAERLKKENGRRDDDLRKSWKHIEKWENLTKLSLRKGKNLAETRKDILPMNIALPMR